MQNSNYHDDEIRLKDVLLQAKRIKKELFLKKKMILISFFIFSLLGLLYSSQQDTTYIAQLNFVVEDNQNNGGINKYAGLAAQFGFDLGVSSATFSQGNIVELLESRRVVEEALLSEVIFEGDSQLLINYHIDKNYRQDWVEEKIEIKSIQYNQDRSLFTLKQDSLLGDIWEIIIDNNIFVDISDESNIVNVRCESSDEMFSKFLAESLVKQVSEYYTHTQTAKARHTLDFIQNRADSVLLELKSAELNYARHKDSNFGVMRAEGLIEELRLQREVEILNVMYAEIIKNLEISKVTLLNQKPLVDIIDSPILPLEERKSSLFLLIFLFGFLAVMLSSIYIIIRLVVSDVLNS